MFSCCSELGSVVLCPPHLFLFLKPPYQLPTLPSVRRSCFPFQWFLSKPTSADFVIPIRLHTLWLIFTNVCTEQWAEASRDTAACKGLISYQLWHKDVCVESSTCLHASTPPAQKLLPLGLTIPGFWSWISGVKANIFSPESGSHYQNHIQECVVFSHLSISKLTFDCYSFVLFFLRKEKEICFF